METIVIVLIVIVSLFVLWLMGCVVGGFSNGVRGVVFLAKVVTWAVYFILIWPIWSLVCALMKKPLPSVFPVRKR